MKKLNLDTGLLKKIAAAMGLDPKAIARDQLGAQVRQRMEAALPRIVADLREDGHTVAQEGEVKVIRAALFCLWRHGVFTFAGGGHLADLVRDSHDDHVIAALAEPVTEATPLAEIVRLALVATVELAF